MSTTINSSNGSSGNCSTSSSTDDDFKFLVHSLKCCLSASDRFLRFIQLSSSHGSIMADNLPTIQSILLEIILKLLSSFKFKFTSSIAPHGIEPKPGFIEMFHQMEKFFMHDHHHWNLIIEETRQSLDKFNAVNNQTKYEDLIQFVHLSLDHITKSNICLDLQSFAILFNIMASSQSSNMNLARLPCNQLKFSPLSILPKRRLNQVRVIKSTNCVTPPRSPITRHSKFSLSTHRRRLNFDALDEEENGTNGDGGGGGGGGDIGDNDSTLIIQSPDEQVYQLIPFPLIQCKIYSRPEGYSYQPHKLKSTPEIPLELQVDHLPDPRNVNRMVIVHNPNQKRSIRTLHSNGTITVNLTVQSNDTDDYGLDSDTIVIPDENPQPAKRKRIVWDLE